jgi:hypothetical protein
VKIYVVAVKALNKKERQDETQSTIKIAGKTSLFGLQLFHVLKFQVPVTHLMPYYVETGSSWPLIARLYR